MRPPAVAPQLKRDPLGGAVHSESWPKTREVKYLLLLLGLVPFGEIIYIAGPGELLPIAVGLVGALAVGVNILTRVERIRARNQSTLPRHETGSSTVPGSIPDGRDHHGAA